MGSLLVTSSGGRTAQTLAGLALSCMLFLAPHLVYISSPKAYTLYVLRCVGSRPRRVGAWDGVGDRGCGGLVRCVIVCVLCCVYMSV